MDTYSFLHFCVGAVMYYWGMPLQWFILLHTIFEILENTETGMALIRWFGVWPGDKDYADAVINSVGDTIFATLGWLTAYCISNF